MHDELDRVPLGFGGLYGAAGDHIGHFYEAPDEWLGLAADFLKAGLDAGERCVYIVGADATAGLNAALSEVGVDVGAATDAGRLTFDPGRESPAEMQELLREALVDVPNSYPLLRWGGHMTWSLGKMPTTATLMEWESCCNVVDEPPAVFLCHYDLKAFLGSVVMDALRTHPVCVIGETIHQNPFYESPEAFLEGLHRRETEPLSS